MSNQHSQCDDCYTTHLPEAHDNPLTQPNQSELKCGHTAPDWNGEGDCITCARNKILDEEKTDETTS